MAQVVFENEGGSGVLSYLTTDTNLTEFEEYVQRYNIEGLDGYKQSTFTVKKSNGQLEIKVIYQCKTDSTTLEKIRSKYKIFYANADNTFSLAPQTVYFTTDNNGVTFSDTFEADYFGENEIYLIFKAYNDSSSTTKYEWYFCRPERKSQVPINTYKLYFTSSPQNITMPINIGVEYSTPDLISQVLGTIYRRTIKAYSGTIVTENEEVIEEISPTTFLDEVQYETPLHSITRSLTAQTEDDIVFAPYRQGKFNFSITFKPQYQFTTYEVKMNNAPTVISHQLLTQDNFADYFGLYQHRYSTNDNTPNGTIVAEIYDAVLGKLDLSKIYYPNRDEVLTAFTTAEFPNDISFRYLYNGTYYSYSTTEVVVQPDANRDIKIKATILFNSALDNTLYYRERSNFTIGELFYMSNGSEVKLSDYFQNNDLCSVSNIEVTKDNWVTSENVNVSDISISTTNLSLSFSTANKRTPQEFKCNIAYTYTYQGKSYNLSLSETKSITAYKVEEKNWRVMSETLTNMLPNVLYRKTYDNINTVNTITPITAETNVFYYEEVGNDNNNTVIKTYSIPAINVRVTLNGEEFDIINTTSLTLPATAQHITLAITYNNSSAEYKFDKTIKNEAVVSYEAQSIPEYYLGETLISVLSKMLFKATFASGSVQNYINNDRTVYPYFPQGLKTTNEVSIDNDSRITESLSLSYLEKQTSVPITIPVSVWKEGLVPKLFLEKNNSESIMFRTTYTNKADSINANNLVINCNYCRDNEGTDVIFTEKAHFVSTLSDSPSTPEFTIQANQTIGNDYVYNGTQILNIENLTEGDLNLTILSNNKFNSNQEALSLVISIYEIFNVTGIRLDEAYTDYHIGEKFLKEEDETYITLFFMTGDTPRNRQFKLRDAQGISISPAKGTKFNTVDDSKEVTITSVANGDVSISYSIQVAPLITNPNEETFNVRAVLVTSENVNGLNNTLNGVATLSIGQYVLVRENKTRKTDLGIRVLNGTYTFNDLIGYIPQVFDYQTIVENSSYDAFHSTDFDNGQVILFRDYVPLIDGTNNIEVEYPSYQFDNDDVHTPKSNTIDNCRFGILFGNNNAKNRLFVSGNPKYPNVDWYSGEVSSQYSTEKSWFNGNFAYFEDTSYCYYGETDNKIVGYDIVSNDKLLVLKDKSDKETSVYFRTPTLVSVLNNSGTSATDVNNNTLYQEEFALVKGNNSIAGVSPTSIVNLNGDTLFLSNEKTLVGLDLTGIIGDNQRYANSRSYYIDRELKKLTKEQLENAWLWTNNAYLFIVLEDCIYLTYYQTANSDNKQYEWWKVDVKDCQSIIEYNGTYYFGNSNGDFYILTTDHYHDLYCIKSEQPNNLFDENVLPDGTTNKIYFNSNIIAQLKDDEKYKIKILPTPIGDKYMPYKICTISQDNYQKINCDLFIDDVNCGEYGYGQIRLYATDQNGQIDLQRQSILRTLLNDEIYFGDMITNNKGKYHLEEDVDTFTNDLSIPYILKDENGNRVNNILNVFIPKSSLENTKSYVYGKLEEELYIVNNQVGDIDRVNNCVTLSLDEQGKYPVNILYSPEYASCVIKIFRDTPVGAYFITKPFTMGSLNYFKTIYKWTLTNDTGIANGLSVAYVSNKIPYKSMRDMAGYSTIAKDGQEIDFEGLSFNRFDLDKDSNRVPRTYTMERRLDQIKFISFGFKNYEDSNSVLSSMEIQYTLPYGSYGND